MKFLKVIGLDMQIIHMIKNMVTVITVAGVGLQLGKRRSGLLLEELLI